MEVSQAIDELKEYVKVDKEHRKINSYDSDFDKFCDNHIESIEIALKELDRLQKENDLAKKALIANSYEADERNNLLAEVQRLKKENEKLKEIDLTTVYTKGVCDEKGRWRNKIREKIKEYKETLEFPYGWESEHRYAIKVLDDLLKEE